VAGNISDGFRQIKGSAWVLEAMTRAALDCRLKTIFFKHRKKIPQERLSIENIKMLTNLLRHINPLISKNVLRDILRRRKYI